MKFFHLKINQFKKIEHLKSKINLIKKSHICNKEKKHFLHKGKTKQQNGT